MKLEEKTYDVLAWVGKIVLPALSVLYGTIGKIWNLPFTEQIPMTIMAIDVFLNALLGISSANYYKDKAEEIENPQTTFNSDVSVEETNEKEVG